MGAVIGASLAATGLLGPFVCRRLDRVPRHRALRTSLVSLILGCLLIAAAPSAWSLVVGFSAVALGNILYGATTNAWIADTVPLNGRSALVGRVELAWSGAFLIGVPLATAVADITSWQLAYAFVGVAAIGSLVVGPGQLVRDHGSGIGSPVQRPHEVAESAKNDKLQLRTGSPLIVSTGLLMLASHLVLIAYAAWLSERFGLPLGVIGALAIALGIGELAAAVGTIAFSDRMGQLRSARYGLAIMCLSSAGLAAFEDTLLLGIAALFLLVARLRVRPDIDQARHRRVGFVGAKLRARIRRERRHRRASWRCSAWSDSLRAIRDAGPSTCDRSLRYRSSRSDRTARAARALEHVDVGCCQVVARQDCGASRVPVGCEPDDLGSTHWVDTSANALTSADGTTLDGAPQR